MADNWDDDDFTPAPPPKPPTSEFADEDVKDNSDEIETNAAISQPSTAEKQKKIKKDKKDKISNAQTNQSEDIKKLTPREIEELQRKNELSLSKELFGLAEEQNGQGPSSKEEFAVFSQILLKEIRKHQNKSEYYNFLSDLFRELCLNLESEHVRRYGKEISALGAELHKTEKEAEKSKQTKSKKKPVVVVARKNDLLDDIVGATDDGRYADLDDDDFM